ncbi:MAG: hypothetical protein IPJ25_14860 [Rhodocyclaceae bacterium]|nr:hypothetical protein [Rhodocyclaceae bacterium]
MNTSNTAGNDTAINLPIGNLPATGAFSDRSVVLVTPSDQRLAIVSDHSNTRCTYEQGEDTPIFLVIGPCVTDESLGRASTRFGIPVADLQQFRNGQRVSA